MELCLILYDNLISFHPRMFRNKYRSCTKSSWLDQNIKSAELQQTTHRPMQCLEKLPNGKNKAMLKNYHEKWGKPISKFILLLSPLFWQRQLHIYFIAVVEKIHEESNFRIAGSDAGSQNLIHTQGGEGLLWDPVKVRFLLSVLRILKSAPEHLGYYLHFSTYNTIQNYFASS